jgi:ABC-type lipoprotein export system ATPase subunit
MIKLEHISKKYNKHKSNEIVVCNDISLTFEEKGLVTILGESGSGKTTLLNVISGMDTFDSGKIEFAGQSITKYRHKTWDKIRKKYIGYVYQDYNLLKEMTCLENIEPVLRMQGIKSQEEINEKIAYLLKSVGLANYEDRLIKQLSGGQQQRIGFARALANNPKVILADEPTGNLDGKTTIEIMNIIKEIAKTRLVILVTHERVLCNYYSDRIIEISDGKVVKDYLNQKSKTLDYLQEHIINLEDYDKEDLNSDDLHIKRYRKNNQKEKLDIDLIERNNTLYFKVNSKNITRTKYLDDDSEIIIQETSDDFDGNAFNLNDIFTSDESEKKHNAFSFKKILNYSLNKIRTLKNSSKLLYVTLFLLGIVISLSVGLLGEIFYVSKDFNELHENYITIEMDRTQYYDFWDVENVDGVEQMMLVTKPYEFSLDPGDYYQISGSLEIEAQPIDIKFFNPDTLIYGDLPEDYEIVIDQSVATRLIWEYSDIGIKDYDDILNCKFKIRTSGLDSTRAIDASLLFNISGIAKTNSLSVYMKEELIYSFVTPALIDYRILGDDFSIISGGLPEAPGYTMINSQYKSVLLGETPTNIGIVTGHYNISGVYDYVSPTGRSLDFSKVFISKLDYMQEKYFKFTHYRNQDFTVLVYSDNVEETVEKLIEAGYEAKANIYDPTLLQEIKLEENLVYYILSITGILISALFVFFIMRSNLISRTYEINVYRSIGISRNEIKNLFFFEIIIATTLSSLLGILLTTLITTRAQGTILSSTFVRYDWLSLLLVIVGIYLINVFFGLLPVSMMMRKTPADIMKQSDL